MTNQQCQAITDAIDRQGAKFDLLANSIAELAGAVALMADQLIEDENDEESTGSLSDKPGGIT